MVARSVAGMRGVVAAHRLRIVAVGAVDAVDPEPAGVVPCLVVSIGVAIAIGGVLQVMISAVFLLVIVDFVLIDIDVEVTILEHFFQLLGCLGALRRLNQILVQLAGVQNDTETFFGGQIVRHLIGCSVTLRLGNRLNRLRRGNIDTSQTTGARILVAQVELDNTLVGKGGIRPSVTLEHRAIRCTSLSWSFFRREDLREKSLFGECRFHALANSGYEERRQQDGEDCLRPPPALRVARQGLPPSFSNTSTQHTYPPPSSIRFANLKAFSRHNTTRHNLVTR